MVQLIDVPGQGQVEFPDSMNDEQIISAIRGLSAPAVAPAAPIRSEPSSMAGMLPAGAETAPTEARSLPEQVRQIGSGAAKSLDDLARSIASGATFGFADELAAAATAATGVGAQKPGATNYQSALAAERERNKQISPYVSIPGEIAGGLGTGSALGRAGLTLLRPQMPLPASSMIARGAGEGAIYGGLAGAGAGENVEERILGAGLGATLGAPLGAIGGGLAARATKPAAPATVADLEREGSAAYTAARSAGLEIKPEATANLAKTIRDAAEAFGYDPKLQPKASVALGRVEDLANKAATLDDLENVRKIMRIAAQSPDRSDRALANRMIKSLDESVVGIGADDILAGDKDLAVSALTSARSLWARKSKGETLEGLISRAEDRASQYSGAGFENALRTEFRNFAMSDRKMRGFNKDEQEAIRAVGKGNLTDNALRFLGKFAPRGPVGTGVAGGIGAVLGGGPGAVAVLGAGELGRQAATAATLGRAQRAAEMMRAGAAQSRRQLTPLELQALRGSAIAPTAAFPGGLLSER